MSHERDETPPPHEVTKLLWAHADATAERVIDRLGGPLRLTNLEQFLRDKQCLRYVTSIHFDGDELEPHQFAEPVLHGEGAERHCCLYIHPRYQGYPEAVPYLVAYMAAAITYGDAADPDLCEHLGSMLVKEPKDAFYARICRLADLP
ncbi:MAG: hypothetical protein JNK74_08320 [Candidatus Hydrogenedentes bacterium]|nr:hypothetical protein [Candidatus Hydrogenedentota bacterium]